MTNLFASIQKSHLARLLQSFEPSTRAALTLLIPYAIIDAMHYFTAGSALVFTTPVIIIIYLWCGFIAARISFTANGDMDQLPQQGFKAGLKLWLFSTVINALIAIAIGVASLGATLLLGIPNLLICGPVFLVGSGIIGWAGGWITKAYYRRIS